MNVLVTAMKAMRHMNMIHIMKELIRQVTWMMMPMMANSPIMKKLKPTKWKQKIGVMVVMILMVKTGKGILVKIFILTTTNALFEKNIFTVT